MNTKQLFVIPTFQSEAIWAASSSLLSASSHCLPNVSYNKTNNKNLQRNLITKQQSQKRLICHLLAPVLALPPLVLLHGGLHQAVDRLSRMFLLRRVPPAVRPDLRLQRRGGLFLREEACPHLATGDQLWGDREVLHQ